MNKNQRLLPFYSQTHYISEYVQCQASDQLDKMISKISGVQEDLSDTIFFTTNSVIWAYGGSGVGKTLYALNRSFSDPKICYIACSALPIVDFECAIENALNEVVVIFDDTDIFLKKSRVEKFFFSFLKRTTATTIFLSRHSPHQLVFELADFESRVKQAFSVKFHLPDTIQLGKILSANAKARGIILSPAVFQFILNNGPRNPGKLALLLNHLDTYTLEIGKKLTIPIIRQFFDIRKPYIDK